MSISVKNSNNEWVQCAGQGRAEYGASTVRTGTATITTSSTVGGAVVKNVTFNSPMPDATYEVTLTLGGEGDDSTATVVYNTKTANGFTIRLTTLHSAASGKSVTIGYTAFKLYTDTEYNQVLDSVPELVEITSLSDVRALSGGKVYDLWVKSPITISGVTIPKFAECVYFKPVLNRDQTLSFHNVYTGEGGLACITDVFFNTDGTYAVKQYT